MEKKNTLHTVIIESSLCSIHQNEKGTMFTFHPLLSAIIPGNPKEQFFPAPVHKRGKPKK